MGTSAHHGSQAGLSLGARTAFCMLPALCLAAALGLGVAHSLPLAFGVPWVPALGIDLAFRIDYLSELMLLMITGVGLAVFFYAAGYFAGHPAQGQAMTLIAALLLILAAILLVMAAWAVVVLPDALSRQHAATKAGTLALKLACMGVALWVVQQRVKPLRRSRPHPCWTTRPARARAERRSRSQVRCRILDS